jgi:hypothetical protein
MGVHNCAAARGFDARKTVAEILAGKRASITDVDLPPGSPGWDEIRTKTWAEIDAGAKAMSRATRQSRSSSHAGIRQVTIYEFLNKLEDLRVAYRLDRSRDALMVVVDVPGERWEVEFFPDGSIEVERFRSSGGVTTEEALDELWPLTE